MINILRKQNGMSIVGQGGKIILFVLPSLIAALWSHAYLPQFTALPKSFGFIKPVGYVLLLPGLIFWATAVIQLLRGFSKGELITTGAYGVARNPIYSSAAFYILPAVALLTWIWVYFVVSIFLYIGVMILLGKRRNNLRRPLGRSMKIIWQEWIASFH
jgi:hypothetical protein